jgi:chemotaxis methyl-accepting protein methylase
MQSNYLFFEGTAPQRSPRFDRSAVRANVKRIPVTATDPGEFFKTLFNLAELPVSAYRSSALARRIPACLRYLRAKDAEHASSKISENPQLATAALNVVLLGVTDFFRDDSVFDYLRSNVLPLLLDRQGKLRIWSAACSEGHELYSVAMLVAEAGRLAECDFVGTDCRKEAIDLAGSGNFSIGSLDRVNHAWRRKYFTTSASSAVINASLRARTTWIVADLLREVQAGPWHMILWRNMAIYLETTAAEEIWRRLCDKLEPGGFLVGGKADHPPKWLPLRRVGPCIYQKEN